MARNGWNGTLARAPERRASRRSTGEYAIAVAPARAPRGRPPYAVTPDDPELVALRREVASRLRAVCAGMDAAAFGLLVRDGAAFKLRWAPR